MTALRLGPGTVLLHIGPHKTGTTSVQSALHGARRELHRRGIHYAGAERQPVVAAQAAIEEPGPGGTRRYSIARWKALLAEIERHRSERVVLSSEWFADAEPAAIRRIVAGLGGDRVHAVVTVRSLVRLLPSQWQQYVAAGATIGYERWLESVFGPREAAATPSFWFRHRHDRLVARWAAAVGTERMTVVVVDEADHGAVLRAFESLVGLATGTLVAEPDRANRSLTAPEADLLRVVNARLAESIHDPNLRLNLGLYGVAAALRMRTPGPAEPRIETPAWAIQEAGEVEAEIVAGLRGSGVRMLGDPASLAGSPASGTGAPRVGATTDAAHDETDWPGIIAAAGIGAFIATGLGRTGRGARSRLAPLPSERLLRVVWHRSRDAIRNPIRARRGASGGASGGATSATLAKPAWAPTAPLEIAATLGRLREAFEAEGLPRTLYDSVVGEGVASELLSLQAPATDNVDGGWPAIGATVVLGIVRASGLIPGGRSGRRLPPPRARIETLDVARTSNLAIVIEIGRRAVAGLIRGARRSR